MAMSEAAANDGLQYPQTFNEFMGVVDRWHRARVMHPREGEGIGEALLRTAHELDDAVAVLRQVWERAQRAPSQTPDAAMEGR